MNGDHFTVLGDPAPIYQGLRYCPGTRTELPGFYFKIEPRFGLKYAIQNTTLSVLEAMLNRHSALLQVLTEVFRTGMQLVDAK